MTSDVRPDRTASAAHFVADLRRLRTQAGGPSLRDLGRIAARRGTEHLPPSTTSEVLGGKRLPSLPRLEFVESYVGACLTRAGRTEDEIAAETAHWREAWQSLAEAKPSGPPVPAPARATTGQRRRWVLVAVAFVAGAAVGSAGTLWYAAGRTGDEAVAGPETPDGDDCTTPGPATTGRDVIAGLRPWWINNDRLPFDPGDREFSATVRPGTSRPSDVIIVKSAVPLVAGRRYALTFTARSDHPARFRVRAQDNEPPSYAASFERELPAGPQPCFRRYAFTAGKTSAQSELTFQVGGQPGEFRLTVSAITLVELA